MYLFLEGILVPKTSKVSQQTPKVFERGSEYHQIDFKWPQNYSKITPKGSKLGPNGPKMPLKNHSLRLIIPHSAYFRRSRAMNTLREPFGDLPKPRSTLRGHSFTLWVALKGLGRAKKGPMGLFLPFKGNNCLKFSPKKGHNMSKCCPNCFSTRVKRGQNG